MRILLISVDFTPHRDGVSTFSHHYARRLAELGHTVGVVGPAAPGARAEDAAAPYRAWRFPGYGLGLLRFVPFAVCSVWALLRHRPDVVLPMNIGYGGMLCGAWAPFARWRYVMFAYAYEFMKAGRWPILRAAYRRIYARSAGVIAISEFTRGELARFGVDPSRISVLPPGVTPAPAAAAPTAPSAGRPPAIGTCGRLIRRKGHDVILRALPAVRREVPEVRYVIAGSGPEEAALRRLAAELGVADCVEFRGMVSPEGLAQFYREIDVFVMPSRAGGADGHAEGFGLVYLEAATYGVPSVATRTGGIPEAVLDGRTGLLVEQDDAPALAAALVRLLRDGDERRRLGQAAQTRAKEEFDWDRRVDRFESWLRTTAPGAKPADESDGSDRSDRSDKSDMSDMSDGLVGAGGRPLRVAMLTRTGRSSGMRFASVVAGTRHHLCGVLAEKRSTMLLASLRRRGLLAFVRRYGVAFLWSRLIERLRSVGKVAPRDAPPGPEVTTVRALNSPEAERVLDAWKPDVLLVANAPVLKPGTFGRARLAAVNFHSGRLPEYGGVASEFWVLHDAQPEAWFTLHQVVERLDSGGILLERAIPVRADDTPDTLHDRLIEEAARALPELLDRMAAGEAPVRRQPGPARLRPWPSAADWRHYTLRKGQRASAKPGEA